MEYNSINSTLIIMVSGEGMTLVMEDETSHVRLLIITLVLTKLGTVPKEQNRSDASSLRRVIYLNDSLIFEKIDIDPHQVRYFVMNSMLRPQSVITSG